MRFLCSERLQRQAFYPARRGAGKRRGRATGKKKPRWPRRCMGRGTGDAKDSGRGAAWTLRRASPVGRRSGVC